MRFSLVIAIETELRAVKSASALHWDRRSGRLSQQDPVIVRQHHSALWVRLGTDRHPPEVILATVVPEADEQPLDRLHAELAEARTHTANGAKPTR
jgi:hypothetical protein